MSGLLLTITALIFIRLVTEVALHFLNMRHIVSNINNIPQALDPDTYHKSIQYTLAKNQFSVVELFYDALWLVFWLTSGILPYLWEKLALVCGTSLWSQAFRVIFILLITTIPALYLDFWQQFTIETRFGFNRSTKALWCLDKIKGTLLVLAIGTPILVTVLAFFEHFSRLGWLFAGLFVICTQIILSWIAPKWLIPLFNKLTPLPDGELKSRLHLLASKAGFSLANTFVIDGSKRSSHSNAYFTGFGKTRTIALFDTLIQDLSPEEIEAVMAHEIGHYKMGHIPQRIFTSALLILGFFGLLQYLCAAPSFLPAFGFSQSYAQATLLLLLAGGVIQFFWTPIANAWARHHEYQADQFAAKTIGSSESLVKGLWKLYKKNLSNWTPHPAYSCVYYSHPTILEREKALYKHSE